MMVESERKERRERGIIAITITITTTITIITIRITTTIIEKPSCARHKANTKQQRHFAR